MLVLGALVVALVGGCSAVPAQPSGSPAPAPTATAAVTHSERPQVEPAPTRTPAPAEIWDVDSAESLQVVVNKRRPMDPADFAPELVTVSTGNEDGAEVVRPELDAALTALDAAMRAAIGEGTFVTSSYRSYDLQATYYRQAVARFGQQGADTTSARPGHSEHQTGLAIDLMSTSMQCRLAHCFGDTEAGRWIAAHAWEHGFVVRYPEGSDAVTGYAWEPWHLRYVGPEVSSAMHEQGIATLEEFFRLPPAPDYAS